MYVDVILFVMCKEIHTSWNVYINLTQTMLVTCLTVVCWRVYVLFTLIVLACAQWCPTYTVLCFSFVLFRLVYTKLSISLDCYFWIALWYSLTCSYRRLTFPNCMWTPTFSVKHKNLCFFDLRIAITFDIFFLLHMYDLLYL